MNLSASIKDRGMACARGIADWLCNVQYPHINYLPNAGTFPWIIDDYGNEYQANNWNHAFAVMGLLSAHKVFGDEKYKNAALAMGGYMKSLQIFDPFKKEHYGAIREMAPQTPWCYTRDALSTAWSFLELHKACGDTEYLERARLWAEWFFREGLDETPWPLWGVQFEPYWEGQEPHMRNDTHGSFQGGGLNFLYHMAKESGDPKWTGEVFRKMADYFITFIQQPSGYFCTIDKTTKKPPESDPQNGLHRANDDLGTLGLLCAYRATGEKKYLRSIEKFLSRVFEIQRPDGHFEESAACIPVALNILREAKGTIEIPSSVTDEKVAKALEALYARQNNSSTIPRARGAIMEFEGKKDVCARSSCYALIALLKLCSGQSSAQEFLSAR